MVQLNGLGHKGTELCLVTVQSELVGANSWCANGKPPASPRLGVGRCSFFQGVVACLGGLPT